jgi:hypothetical protein
MSLFPDFPAMNRRATIFPSLRDEEDSELILTPRGARGGFFIGYQAEPGNQATNETEVKIAPMRLSLATRANIRRDSIRSGVELEKGLHDEVYRVLIYVKIFPSLCENRLPHERSIDGGNLKCRKIDGIVMPCAKFVRYGPKSGLGVAARADHVEIVTKRGPEVYGRDCDNQFTCRVMNGHDCMNAFQVLEVLRMPAHPERIAAHVSAFVDIGA